jgi:hypothetical protein
MLEKYSLPNIKDDQLQQELAKIVPHDFGDIAKMKIEQQQEAEEHMTKTK